MVAFSSLPFPPSFLNPNPNPNPYPTFYHLHTPKPPSFSPRYRRRHFHLSFKPFAPLPLPNPEPESESELEPEPEPEKPSFAVATGELFISIASRLIGAFRPSPVEELGSVQGDEERIAVVVEDDVEVVGEGKGETVVLWEQRVKDVEAERRRETVTSPGFSFSAAGLLFPYHLGVAQFLIQNGYIKESTPLAGSSAGAIVCAVIASGTSMHDALEATKVLADDCRLSGTAFRLGGVLRGVLDRVLPDDIHIRCNGRIRVAVTQIVWRPRGLLVDQFDSKEDVINALITSSFIPGYLAPRPATMFRNKLCVDGGLTIFMPPTSASQTVRVCAFPASSLRMQGIGISPDCNPDTKLTTRQLLNWALEPAEDLTLDKLFELGYSDAAVWATENPVNSIVQEDIVSTAKESPVNSVVEEDMLAMEKPLNLKVQEDTL